MLSMKKLLGSILTVVVLAGCASVKPLEMPERVFEEGEDGERGWWRVRFRMAWPPDREPAWHVDFFLAHRVVSPVLGRYGDRLSLWRFHRRAARDGAGHQFSFLFYSTPSTARGIYDEVRGNDLLARVVEAGVIEAVRYDDIGTLSMPRREDTSDRHWPESVQKAWPAFIMGASRTWVELIHLTALEKLEEDGPLNDSPSDVLEFYREVSESVTALWREEGRHAFLHHLNALFGYEPVVVYERKLMRF